MLIRFRVENFRSIRDEQELSLVASSLTEHPEMVREVNGSGVRLLPAAAIYGPNASGKSTVFAALLFMRNAVLESHRSWSPAGGVPHEPHAFDPSKQNEPATFTIDLAIGGVRYEYGFSVDATQVVEERLYAWPQGKRQEWFTRATARDVEFSFNRRLGGENRAIAAVTRPNSLFLSAAAQNNHPALLRIYYWFSQNLWIVDDSSRRSFQEYTVEQCRTEPYRRWVLELLQAADLGISDIVFSEGEEIAFDLSGWSPDFAEHRRAPLKLPPNVQLVHASADRLNAVSLPFETESRGTRTLFSLLGILTWSLQVGATLVVDELDQSLHSELARRVVALFTNVESNPQGAQLVFNTHDTNLLDSSLLRRDQVWFTEKGADGATRLYPLTDFHARKHENLERGYLQGRYGAVPSVDASVFDRFPGVG